MALRGSLPSASLQLPFPCHHLGAGPILVLGSQVAGWLPCGSSLHPLSQSLPSYSWLQPHYSPEPQGLPSQDSEAPGLPGFLPLCPSEGPCVFDPGMPQQQQADRVTVLWTGLAWDSHSLTH